MSTPPSTPPNKYVMPQRVSDVAETGSELRHSNSGTDGPFRPSAAAW